MRSDAALGEKYEGEYSGRGRRRKYGERLDYDNLPKKYLRQSELNKGIITNIYQGIFVHREFGSELNVVIIEKLNVKNKRRGHAILFSSDVELSWEKLMDYYRREISDRVQLSGSQATFRVGRFYGNQPNGSGKCGKSVVSDGLVEQPTDKKQCGKMCRNK